LEIALESNPLSAANSDRRLKNLAPLLIRPATIADIRTLIALEQSVATAAHWSEEQYQAAIAQSSRLVQVAQQDSTVVGFVVARGVDPEWEIENIVVAVDSRRRGIGTKLIAEFLHTIRERKGQVVFLEVRESNTTARRFYETAGFVECGRRKLYYQEPEEDAILYRRNLA
jgi:[ribosomal protein S18]-alanine N-acetyltransferase